MKLTIELVPTTCWYNNVRSNVRKKDWDIIRKKCYEKSNYVCDICGGKGYKHSVECHEIWEYNDKKNIQTLKGLTSLCPSCHQVKHLGLAILQGKEKNVINQLKKVNNIDDFEAKQLIIEAFKVHNERSKKEWVLNIDFLNNYIKDI